MSCSITTASRQCRWTSPGPAVPHVCLAALAASHTPRAPRPRPPARPLRASTAATPGRRRRHHHQVPQYILEDAVASGQGARCNIIVTQPRRISALGLASRVASERGERVGEVVGYSVRLESKTSALTRLLFCTTGALPRGQLCAAGALPRWRRAAPASGAGSLVSVNVLWGAASGWVGGYNARG